MITAKIRRTHRNTAKKKMPPAQSAAIAAPTRPINSANTATTVATMHRPRNRLAWERLARSLLSCVSSSHRSNGWPEPFPGQHFPHHPVDLRPRDYKPVAGSAEKLRPAGTGPRGDASQPRCGSRTRPGLRRFSPSQTPFLYANGSLPRMPTG